MPDRTELTWSYKPQDFFEEAYVRSFDDWCLRMEGGTAVATVSGGRLSGAVESEIAETVTTLFRVRAMQIDRGFTLADQVNVVEHRGDKRHVVLRVQESVVVRDRLDVQITEVGTGAIMEDTKAERIKAEEAELETLSAQSQQNSTLRTILASYTSAINEPPNALTHLYEVRDALAKHFGSEAKTKNVLGISSSDWSTFGRLANDEPLLEGRHRGKHGDSLRPATPEELSSAKSLARDWIRRFARTLSCTKT